MPPLMALACCFNHQEWCPDPWLGGHYHRKLYKLVGVRIDSSIHILVPLRCWSLLAVCCHSRACPVAQTKSQTTNVGLKLSDSSFSYNRVLNCNRYGIYVRGKYNAPPVATGNVVKHNYVDNIQRAYYGFDWGFASFEVGD